MKKYDENKLYIHTLRNYIERLLENKRLFWLSFLNPLSSLVTSVAIPFIASQSFNSIVTQDGTFKNNMILLSLAVVVGVALNRLGFTALLILHANTLKRLNNQIFNRVLSQSVNYHQNQIGGKLVSDALDYMSSFGTLHVLAFTKMSSLVLTISIGLLVILSQSIIMGGVMALVIGVTVYSTTMDSLKRSNKRTLRHRTQKKMISHFSDSLVNAVTIKIFAAQKHEEKTHRDLTDLLEKQRASDWLESGNDGNRRIAVLLVGIVLLLITINHLISSGQNDLIGTGIFAFTYTFGVFLRLFDLHELSRQLEDGFLRARPMTRMLLMDNEVQDVDNAKKLAISDTPSIDFKDIKFKYEEDDSGTHIFSDLSIHIPPNQKVGLVGPSGGGKTTLTKVLLRFSDLQSGEILVDGQDIAKVTQDSLRRSIGYVPQEPLLFHRTVKENIAYGRPNATMQEIRQAAKSAQAHEFIQALSKGYDTTVGERGVKLSGGQRQRIAIARAILKSAPILVLDEATSALDSESEVAVQKALGSLMQNKTSIVIAHRLSTIQKMDRILVLNDGKVVEDGSHSQLIKKKGGMYAKLWAHQSGGFIED